MAWPEKLVNVLKEYNIEFISYVPDAKGEKILEVARKDKQFEILPLAREEEGIGVVCGQALGGKRGGENDHKFPLVNEKDGKEGW